MPISIPVVGALNLIKRTSNQSSLVRAQALTNVFYFRILSYMGFGLVAQSSSNPTYNVFALPDYNMSYNDTNKDNDSDTIYVIDYY